MLIFTLSVCSLMNAVFGHLLESPCPSVLRYEEGNSQEPDRIYGTLTLSTNENLEGVWVKVFFDRKVYAFGNSFSDAISRDNTEFHIRNPTYQFSAGAPILIRFFVQYDVTDAAPNIVKINLNGKVVCPNNKPMDTSSWHITDDRPYHSPGHRGRPKWPSHENGFRPDISFNPNRELWRGDNNLRPQSTQTFSNNERPLLNEGFDRRGSIKDIVTLSASPEDDDEFFQGDFTNVQNKGTTSRAVTTPRHTIHCGTAAQRATPLITNAQETSPGQWPWHAALYINNEAELKYSCGSTLISEQHVVTAAHCVTKPRTNRIVSKDKLVLYFGKYNLIRFGSEVQDRQIDSITVHPDYNATILFNDLAVLKVDSPVEINNFVRPCCLWQDQDTNLENLVGKKGTVVGWGYNEHGQLSQNLMKAEMPIVSTSNCLFSNRDFFSIFLSDKNFCAGFKNGTSVCNGDSGGGMVVPVWGTRGENSVWQLRGVVSIGVAKQNQAICDTKQYSIFTDVAKYVPWIKQIIEISD
ncbi:limulus clotting factor C-like isoform X2 [Euwallacea fornicatus]|uniref:limulus clotting factor C-like isoform X2 n=1 Tax=Euwallacea fornicatus TaxID=995702 RepID=UPI00338EF38C